MSKVKIKCTLKSKDTTHTYEGKGVLNNNTIIYNDSGVNTKIILSDIIWLKRKKDYEITLGFSNNKSVKGTYIMKEGKMITETDTIFLKKEKNSIKIKYNLKINKVLVDTFELNFKFTIDSI
ncbi:MAG: DUF1934 family protein [Bacilli bacterium]|nr:DUF1934 family protein [Bacilli bacterium]